MEGWGDERNWVHDGKFIKNKKLKKKLLWSWGPLTLETLTKTTLNTLSEYII